MLFLMVAFEISLLIAVLALAWVYIPNWLSKLWTLFVQKYGPVARRQRRIIALINAGVITRIECLDGPDFELSIHGPKFKKIVLRSRGEESLRAVLGLPQELPHDIWVIIRGYTRSPDAMLRLLDGLLDEHPAISMIEIG